MTKNKNVLYGGIIVVLIIALGFMIYQIIQSQKLVVSTRDISDSFPIAAEPVEVNPQFAESDGPYAILHTTAGDITILLYPEQVPKAVDNFITLAKEGYYDGSEFFFVKRDLIAQTGKPMANNPAAETVELPNGEIPTYADERSKWNAPFEDEFDDGLHNFCGAVAMAGSALGQDKNQSQFYLLTNDKKPEDERSVPALLYRNELVRMRLAEFSQKYSEATPSEAEIEGFQNDINEEVQNILVDGVPNEYLERYLPAKSRYEEVGGDWALDYKATVFGQIVKGLNVAKAITQVKTEPSTRSPVKLVVIDSIEIVDSIAD